MKSALIVGLALLSSASVASSQSEEAERSLPTQMFHLPLEIAPRPDAPRMPVRLEAVGLALPDQRHGQILRLSWWTAVGSSHHVRVALDYVGLESDRQFRWGGGAALLHWSTRMGQWHGRTFAFDVAGNLPHGDEALHPLSAKAPTIQARLRVDLLSSEQWELWAAIWGRRVSPPSEDRINPLSDFPSGRGYDLVARHVWSEGSGAVELVLQRPLTGMPEATWVHAVAELPVAGDLAVRAGAMLSMATAENRPIDHGWTLGVTWRPSPSESGGDDDTRGRGF